MVLAVGLAHRTLAGYQVRFLESVFMVLRSLMAGERDCDSRRYWVRIPCGTHCLNSPLVQRLAQRILGPQILVRIQKGLQ